MKKVLVTGAAGSIGINVIKYLLSEGKYEITAVDLKTNEAQKRLRKYRKRINIVLGDITDPVLVDGLVKDQDYIIHLAGIMTPLAELKKNLAYLIDYKGTENIIRSINYYNPKCYLLYPSSTLIYGDAAKCSVTSKAKVKPDSYYAYTKKESENLVKDKIENFIIFRLPMVLTNPRQDVFIYNGNYDNLMEVITNEDAAYAFVKALDNLKKLNKHIYNVGGGKNSITTYRNIIINVLSIYGLSFNFILARLFMEKDFYGHIYTDSDKLEEILKFRNDSTESYYMRLKRSIKNRKINKLLAKPIVNKLKKGE